MEAIEERAADVLAEVPDWIWDGKSLPVPIEDIASSCHRLLVSDVEDLTLAPGCPDVDEGRSLSGLLLSGRREIWVNAAEAKEWPRRRRFTIGHELGHWVLHRAGNESIFCRSTNVQPEEQDESERPPDIEEEASVFAAALLMPAPLIERYYRSLDRDQKFERMCAIFDSSAAAMGRRLHAVI